jgi:hypothetical protein
MPTLIGVVFFAVSVYCFIWKEDSLFGILIVAAAFQASSAINFGERGIAPYYVVAGFIILRAVCRLTLGTYAHRPVPHGGWLMFFGAIAVASAVVYPVVFAGIPIYDPKIGIDEGLLIRPPLSLGINNFAQAGFLVWHIATVYALSVLSFSASRTRRALIFAFQIVVFVLLVQFSFQLLGIPFPYRLIDNNPGYSIWISDQAIGGTRNPATFSEPSLAGTFLVFYSLWFLTEYLRGRGSMLRVLIALVALGLVGASGALLTLCMFIPVVLVRFSPFRFPWYLNTRRATKLFRITLALAAPLVLVLVLASGYRETLVGLTVAKSGSGSFLNRTAADLYALQLLMKSHWIGVGLGSNRASSLVTTLLSNVGIAGVLCFIVFLWRLFRDMAADYPWLVWAAFALLLNMSIDVADVTMPLLWIPILTAVTFSIHGVNREQFRHEVIAGSDLGKERAI